MEISRGKTIQELSVGDSACLEKCFSEADLTGYASISGDKNPIHIDSEAAGKSIFKKQIAQGMLVSGLISGVIGTQLPGPGCIYLEQILRFKAPVFIDDTICATVTITEILPEKNLCKLSTICTKKDGTVVIEGTALIRPKPK